VWMASYGHSRAESNAVLEFNIDQTLQVADNFGPMPWDVPNRFLSEGYLPLPLKNWAVAYLADWRTGFPFSVVTPGNQVIGAVNSQRFGANFDLNLHLERRFNFLRYRFALRLGANNLTDQRNATAVNNVAGAPNYLRFYGSEGRHFVLRIRMFGRVK
jgi:outer membrane receptor protein involved in Fe transport